jgi:hypothetical protein
MVLNSFVNEMQERMELAKTEERTNGDKMTPHVYTDGYEPSATIGDCDARSYRKAAHHENH